MRNGVGVLNHPNGTRYAAHFVDGLPAPMPEHLRLTSARGSSCTLLTQRDGEPLIELKQSFARPFEVTYEVRDLSGRSCVADCGREFAVKLLAMLESLDLSELSANELSQLESIVVSTTL